MYAINTSLRLSMLHHFTLHGARDLCQGRQGHRRTVSNVFSHLSIRLVSADCWLVQAVNLNAFSVFLDELLLQPHFFYHTCFLYCILY
jgi:hypothetical protein